MMPTSRLLLAGLLLTSAASAQTPVPPAPAGAPVLPAAVPPPAAGLGQKVKQDGYLEPKINGERLAELYSELTGRRVTVSNAAIAAEFRFVQKGPITFDEATELLKIAAVMEGFVFIPSGENHDKLVYSQSVASPTDEDLAVITDPADLPEGEQVVRYVMTLKYIKPDEMVRAFTSIVKQFGNFGSIVAVPNASSLIITENTSLIRSLIELQETIDVASQNVETRFIKVQYADVQELAETLNEILGTQQQGQTSAGIQRVQPATPVQGGGVPNIGNAAASAAGAAGVDGGGAGEDVPVQIVPNARTNEIFVMGRPVDIVFAEGLIKGFDSPSDTRNSLSRKLKFLPVADFLPVAEQALQRAFSGSAEGGSAGGGSAGGGRPTGANFGGNQGGGARGAGSGRNSTAGNGSFGGGSSGGFGGGSGGGGIGGSSLGEPNVSSAPTSLLVGRTLLVADNITNSIVIQGPPASVEIINQLLDKIDVKADQVMISCVFGQLALGDDLQYGIDFLKTLDRNKRGDNAFGGRGGSGNSGAILPLDNSTFDPTNFAATAGLGIYGKIGRYMNVYLKALQDSSRFNVISRPTVFMSNNQKGTIKSGKQVAVPTNSFNSGGVGGSSTNIEYRDIALSLEVIPLVNSNEEVTLQIYLLNDEIVGYSDEISNVGRQPIIATRELVTTVTVPNNETIVLGGLITSRNGESRSGIPILSRIPLLGSLFGNTTKGLDEADEREELLIFIQPRIISDRKSLGDGQVDMEGRYEVEDSNREFIDGPGVDSELPEGKTELNDGKASGRKEAPGRESAGGPRRASTRPKSGFVNRR